MGYPSKNINIRNSNDYKDRVGLLGKALLEANKLKEVYTVSEYAKYCEANIIIVNPNDFDVNVTLWISTNKEPTAIDLIESKIVLKPDAVFSRSNIFMSKLETVFAMSDSSGVVIRIEGNEDRIL